MGSVFGVEVILGSLGAGLVGALVALIVRLVKGDGAAALWRVLETFITATLGAFAAWTFISLMLKLVGATPAGVTAVSLLFFIWPGVVNVISMLASHHPAIGAHGVQWIALVVGGLVGLYDGLWAIHKWLGLGALTFALDVTWGLGGSTNGVLMHLVNTYWGDHADDAATAAAPVENRKYAHRYKSGFRLKPTFAFTQGAVMSNMSTYVPGRDLHNHESIHVWQNRLLGPFFWFSYAGWMVLMLIPALIAGMISSRACVCAALEWWCYFDNPWEVMAYGIANPTGRTGQTDGSHAWLCWPMAVAIPVGIVGTAILLLAFVGIVASGFAH